MIVADEGVERHYASLERKWNVVDGSVDHGRLVVPSGNSDAAYHRWFHLKEAFSVDMLDFTIKRLGIDALDTLRVLDCFAGGGTTVISTLTGSSAYREGVLGVGIEWNPFLYHLASTKVKALMAGTSLGDELRAGLNSVSDRFRRNNRSKLDVPGLSTLSNPLYFPVDHVETLMRLRKAIETADCSDLARDVLLTVAAASVEPASKLRRDGRALRFSANKQPRDPWHEFLERVARVIEDVGGAPALRGSGRVYRGDGRYPSRLVGSSTFDLIIFSPPYPNNIDYTEIYKAEAWYLGCYGSADEFRSQRLSTVRSHPSIRFADSYSYEESANFRRVSSLVQPLMNAIPDDKYRFGRSQVIRGYVDDMMTLLSDCRKLIADDGKLVFVVGNSAHGDNKARFIIAADLLMAELAEVTGWRVEEIAVARQLRRRVTNSQYLRESVVTLSPVWR